ncbi:MAG: hypothetical protein WD448_01310 [Woeseia sp.]
MRFGLTAGSGLATAVLVLIGACGDEVSEPEGARGQGPEKPVCELVRQVDLQQIFVNRLAPDGDTRSSMDRCTLNDAESEEAFVQYELHPYKEDLRVEVERLERELGEDINPRFVQGIGDEAVWTDVGLFVNRSGRTLQVKPMQDDQDRAAYQELARLLLTRLEDG